MSSPYSRIYLEQVYALASTMVIKSSIVAELINNELSMLGHPISMDPHEWKYHMNLAGLYYHTDEPMTVTSADTLEVIDFTRENLLIHRATAATYAYGTPYYAELVARYPAQETLILGILNPIPLETSVNAPDGTILYYDRQLVEPQERSLIPRLEEWCRRYLRRWFNYGYSQTDEYYVPALLGIMAIMLPPEIVNLRIEFSQTNEVHSYHIRQYLASHGGLDVYLPYLTLKQALFLHRNIRYLQRHPGKQETFELLVDRLITDRGLPLAKYEMVHNTEQMPTELLPNIEMHRVALNHHPDDGSSSIRSLENLFERQLGVARGNFDELSRALGPTTERMQNSLLNRLPTKVLESAILDTSGSAPVTLDDILINHWLYMAAANRYTTVVGVTHPLTGVKINLTAKEAFVMYMYLIVKSAGGDLVEIPELRAFKVRKPVVPSHTTLRQVAGPGVADSWLLDAIARQPPMGTYISVAAFREFCTALFEAQGHERTVVAQAEGTLIRASMDAAVQHCYQDIDCDLGVGYPYDVWLAERNIDLSELNAYDVELMAGELLAAVTGSDVEVSSSLEDLQRNMLRLLGDLSSYSIHFLQRINSTVYRVADLISVRVTDYSVLPQGSATVALQAVEPLAWKTSGRTVLESIGEPVTVLDIGTVRGEGYVEIELGQADGMPVPARSEIRYYAPMGDMRYEIIPA